MAGLPNFEGWLADPKCVYWETEDGVRSGTITLRKERQILILSYGLAVFDGCGGRDSAIETNVLGRSALVSQAHEHVLSHVLWPVTETGSTGRFGITGTFEGWAMIRLAESMELARVEAMDSNNPASAFDRGRWSLPSKSAWAGRQVHGRGPSPIAPRTSAIVVSATAFALSAPMTRSRRSSSGSAMSSK